MSTTTEVTLSIADIADRTHLSPRQINNYRAKAESRLGQKLGQKIGKTWYFTAPEVNEILKSREAGNEGSPSTSGNFREAVNFSNTNNRAEGETLGGMESIVQAGDQQAAAIGAAIGQRFVQVVWTTALTTMQQGLFEIGGQFDEIHQAIALPLAERPALPGSDPATPRLQTADQARARIGWTKAQVREACASPNRTSKDGNTWYYDGLTVQFTDDKVSGFPSAHGLQSDD